MKQILRPGGSLEVPTVSEIVAGVKEVPAVPARTVIRDTQSKVVDATGLAGFTVYTVPLGMELEVRRISFNIDSCTDGFTGAVILGVANTYILLRRSENFIEYAMPVAATTKVQVPGIQTWSAVEGPYLRNGERFEVHMQGMTPGATVTAELTGLLIKPTATSPR